MAPLIESRHLHKNFGNLLAVSDVSISIEAGEIYGLVGPDGAGKTTTLRLLCGALKKLSGDVFICGYDISRQADQARAKIGYLSQRFSMYEDLTVLENIRFFAEVRGIPRSEWMARCMSILDFVGLAEFTERRAGYLSGGMKQKLGLAAAMVHRPAVLLLDEPTTGVDPVTRQDFWQLIIRLAKDEAIAMLISTPYMDEASRCHRVGFMREGHLLVEDTPSSLRNRLEGRIIELSGKPLALLRLLAKGDQDVENVQMFGDRLHLRVKRGNLSQVIDRLSSHIPDQGGAIDQIHAVSAQLEDVFISFTEG